jgi:hypothetical protein
MPWINIFKTGSHTDSKGNKKEWSEEDLKQIAKNYNNQAEEDKHNAPLVLGHPKDNAPAYGWVKSFKYAGNKLIGNVNVISKGLVEAVRNGNYRKVSASLRKGDNGYMLNHIGILGAATPAIKGLGDLKFEESDNDECLESAFSAVFESDGSLESTHEEQNTSKKENNLKELLEQFGDGMGDVFDAIMAKLKSDLPSEIAAKAVKIVIDAKAESASKEGKDPDTGKDPAAAKDPKGDAPKFTESADFKAFQKENEQKDERIAELERTNRKAEFKEYLDSLNLVPAQKNIGIQLLEHTHADESEYSFTEAGEEKKLNSQSLVKKLLEVSQPKEDFYSKQMVEDKATMDHTEKLDKSIDEVIEDLGG